MGCLAMVEIRRRHIPTYTHMHTHAYTIHIHTHAHTYLHIHTHAHTHACAYTLTHTHTNTYTGASYVPPPIAAAVAGSKGVGKSSLSRFLVNHLLNSHPVVAYLVSYFRQFVCLWV